MCIKQAKKEGNMRIPILTFGAIASILTINSVMADTVVTSRGYVDAADALKQDKITAGTTGSVVTYNGAQNGQTQFSERGIFNPKTDFDFNNNEVATGHEGDLLDAGSIFPNLVGMSNAIQDIQDNMPDFDDLPETTVTYKTCYQEVNGECILWNLSDKNVYGRQCQSNNDCPCYDSDGIAGEQRCNNGVCTGNCRQG